MAPLTPGENPYVLVAATFRQTIEVASSYAAIYLQLGSVASSDVLISLSADLPWMSHSVFYFA